jgi:hypothetical protein
MFRFVAFSGLYALLGAHTHHLALYIIWLNSPAEVEKKSCSRIHQKALVVLSRKLFLLTATPFLITHSENLFGERAARAGQSAKTRVQKKETTTGNRRPGGCNAKSHKSLGANIN